MLIFKYLTETVILSSNSFVLYDSMQWASHFVVFLFI